MKIGISVSLVAIVLLTIAMLFRSGWERPPIETEQRGYRGLGMVENYNPRTVARLQALNQLPPLVPAAEAGSPPVSSVYKNVQVLNHLSVAEFTRLMVAITSWVSPKEGCSYCHAGTDFASDAPYTKVVARRMLQMTEHINGEWKNHVADTGVTCFTCHRGQPVPAQIWFADPGPRTAAQFAGNRAGQNAAAVSVGLTSLPYDPFTPFLANDSEIRVVSKTALPEGSPHTIKQTEWTYGLMIHMSESLGVNCTYCHNSRSFFAWDASTPQRVTAYHGIRMVRDLNKTYLAALQPSYPPNRLGPLGDAPKLNCATCHQGVSKPLYGASMLKDYPELGAAGHSPTAATGAVVAVGVAIIYFEVDSSALPGAAGGNLAPLIAHLKANPKAKATISGYHSATGDAARNHELAKSRAFAIRDALIAAGIVEDRLIPLKPIAEQANVAGEDQRARRVEVTVN